MVSSVQIQVTMKNDTMLNIKRDKYMHKITIDIIYTILQFFLVDLPAVAMRESVL